MNRNETPDGWIERLDEDCPNQDDACMVCDKMECVCPPEERNGWNHAEATSQRNKWIESIVLALHTETRQPYKLGGKDDPHFQDHGGNFIPSRVESNEEQYGR